MNAMVASVAPVPKANVHPLPIEGAVRAVLLQHGIGQCTSVEIVRSQVFVCTPQTGRKPLTVTFEEYATLVFAVHQTLTQRVGRALPERWGRICYDVSAVQLRVVERQGCCIEARC